MSFGIMGLVFIMKVFGVRGFFVRFNGIYFLLVILVNSFMVKIFVLLVRVRLLFVLLS